MSLFDRAQAIADGAGQICTPFHVFLAALPPYAQYSLDEYLRNWWEQRVPLPVRDQWARELQPELRQFHVGRQGLENDDFKTIKQNAQDSAAQTRKPVDSVALALVLLYPAVSKIVSLTETIIPRGMNPDTLARELRDLDDRFANSGVSPILGQGQAFPPIIQDPMAAEMATAARMLDDGILEVVKPSTGAGFKNFSAVDTNTFLAMLAGSVGNGATVVGVGEDGTLISLLDKVVADRLAARNSFTGAATPLNAYTGALYKIEASTLVSRGGRAGAPKSANILRAAKQRLLALPDKPILLIDHLETIRSQGPGQAQNPDIEDLCFEIGAHGGVLVFGIYHAPDDKSDYAGAASLGSKTIRVKVFKPFDKDQTKQLMYGFFKSYWVDLYPTHSFKFTDDAFDLLIALQPGAWHDSIHKALPGLVIDITKDALDTAILGDTDTWNTATGAIRAFDELKRDELPRTKFKKFEPILKRAEQEVRRLLPDNGNQRFRGTFPPPQQVDPSKPIAITGARVVAEFICHNRSEFHYPDPEFRPAGA